MNQQFLQKRPGNPLGRVMVRRTATVAVGFVAASGLATGIAFGHTPSATGTCDADKGVSIIAGGATSYDTGGVNNVTVTNNGVVVLDQDFAASTTFNIDDLPADQTNTWVAQFTAYNDADGSKGWTKSISGTIKSCVKPTEPPIPPTPPEEPPTTPPTTPEPPKVVKKPKAVVKTSCTGKAVATLNNKRSNARVKFVLSVVRPNGGGAFALTKGVPAHDVRKHRYGGKKFPAGTVLKVSYKGKVLDKVKVPKPCFKPPTETPETGMRTAAGPQAKKAASRLVVPKLKVNARVVMTGKTKGGAQAVTHSLSDVF
jgi:hypothetical protein